MTRLAQELPSWGAGRFQVRRTIGAGVSGVVYEVHDGVRDARLALKALHTLTRERLARLTREFRALESLRHPNLVALDELAEEDGQWFVTMELVEPWDFLSFATTPLEARGEHGLCYDEARLRLVLTQLASGLLALHGAGIIHRAVKPANALVARDGRLVLVDSGSSAELERAPDFTAEQASTSARYLAPEQAAGRPVGPEADWYAMGALLYEALTGKPTFAGATLSVLLEKQRRLPVSPETWAPGASPELCALAMDLLRIEPSLRPSGAEVVQRLGANLTNLGALPRSADVVCFDRARATRISTVTREIDGLFVGRDDELAALDDALARTRSGKQAIVHVRGALGAGKSALVRAFARRAAKRGAVVLASRCFAGESAPYRALDGLVESLVELLRSPGRPRVASLAPRRASLLVRVFPALTRVPSFGFAGEQQPVCPEELRSQFGEAFRELFGRLCERHTVMVSLDDLPWADAESLTLLAELFAPESAFPLLFVGSMDDRHARVDSPRPYGLPAPTHTIALAALAEPEAVQLAERCLEREGGEPARAGWMARAAGGCPLFIEELARVAHVEDACAPTSVNEALRTRIAALEPDLRGLLELLAVSCAPLALSTLRCATKLGPAELTRKLSTLRVMALVRTLGQKAEEAAELQHESVREAVCAQLEAAEQERIHRELARALRGSGHGDFERLAQHYAAGGQAAEALEHTLRAAEQAEHALAFEHAGRLYALALPMAATLGRDVGAMTERKAQALARAGRREPAARAYLEAAQTAEPERARELERRAAEELLAAGQPGPGLSILRGLLAAEGIALPASERGVDWSLRWGLLVQPLGRSSFVRRDQADVPGQQRRRADLCQRAALGLGALDGSRGLWLSMRAIEHARRTGDPYRVARAMSLHASQLCAAGRHADSKLDALLDAAEALASEAESAHALAATMAARGQVRLFAGRFRAAVRCASEAERVLREQCLDVERELDGARTTGLCALSWLGEHGEVSGRIATLLDASRKRGDVLGGAVLRAAIHAPSLLVRGHAAAARDTLAEAALAVMEPGFGMLQHQLLLARTLLALADSALDEAAELAREHGQKLQASRLSRVQLCRVSLFFASGRVALARAVARSAPELLNEAARFARRLHDERAVWAGALGDLLLSGVAMQRAQHEPAHHLLTRALEAAESSELRLEAASARLALGRLTGGDAGLAMIEQARAYFELQGLRSEPVLQLVTPGLGP